jgi:hypothetical protein
VITFHKLFIAALFMASIAGCDIYKKENKNWDNDVTIYFRNDTVCPLYFSLDGTDEGRVETGGELTFDQFGKGIHFLEAYPWNDSQHSCESVYTQKLGAGDRFDWIIQSDSPCSTCDPTPTPAPSATPTSAYSPTATPAP